MIDAPAITPDDDGAHYMFFGGIDGGQLQRWRRNGNFFFFDSGANYTNGANCSNMSQLEALGPRVARLADNMVEFASPSREIEIVDADGQPLLCNDKAARFFEAAW